MQPLARDYKDRFTYYVVTLGRQGDLDYLSSVGAEHVLLDPSGSAFTLYRISAIPATFVVSKEGVIYRDLLGWEGEPAVARFEQIVKAVAGGGP